MKKTIGGLPRIQVVLFSLLFCFVVCVYFGVVGFKAPEPPPNSFIKIYDLPTKTGMYDLSIEGTHYLVGIGGNGGVSIVKK